MMKIRAWRWIFVGAVLSMCAACKDSRVPPTPPPASTAAANPQPEQTTAPEKSTSQFSEPPSQAGEIDVASVYNGAFAADRSKAFDGTKLLVGMKNHGNFMVLTKGPDLKTDFLIELAAPATVERLRFIGSTEAYDDPKKIEVAISNTPTGNFEVIGVAEFNAVKNWSRGDNAFDASIPVSAKHSGRFLRLTMLGSLMGRDAASQRAHAIASFQAWGRFDQSPVLPNINGVYFMQGEFGNNSGGGFYLVLKQEGDWAEGCAVVSRSTRPVEPERLLNLVSGGAQNGVLHIDRTDASGGNKASGLASFSSDGKFVHTAFFLKGSDPSIFGNVHRAVGERISTTPVPCAVAQQPVQTTQQIWENTLEKDKVLELYGVNFDLDSDVLRKESHTVLDKVVAIAKAKPEWTFEVGGHTDSSGSAAHNRDLSQRRSESVVRYLSQAGVDTARLKAKGYGADKPVMPNDTAAGMAKNRRVELVRQ